MGGGPRTPNSSRRTKSKKFGLCQNGPTSKLDVPNVMRLPSGESELAPVSHLNSQFA